MEILTEKYSPSLRSQRKMRLQEELRLKQGRPFVCICHHHCNQFDGSQ